MKRCEKGTSKSLKWYGEPDCTPKCQLNAISFPLHFLKRQFILKDWLHVRRVSQSKQRSMQKGRPARRRINLKPCLSRVGCPADERMKRRSRRGPAAATTAVPYHGSTPLDDLSYASLTHSRQTHCVTNIWAVCVRMKEKTGAWLLYRSNWIIHIKKD